MEPVCLEFSSYEATVAAALDQLEAGPVLREQSAVLVKPNLINASPPPITTPAACIAAVVEYVRRHSRATIVIGEGCGDQHMETTEVFRRLGYVELAAELGVELLDLNTAPLRTVNHPACKVFPEMHLPEIAFTHFLISVPVLKAHSLADITGTLKNMMGLAPPRYYAGVYGSWKKARFHGKMHESILDLNRHRAADLTVLDASVGMAEFHLGGAHCDPPVNRIVAGFDPLAIDRLAADLLGFDWRTIDHLAKDETFAQLFLSKP